MKPKRSFTTTEETRSILSGHEVGVAKAYGCDPSYIYNIKNLNEPDPYAPFREWAQDCANGGASIRPYINDLEAIEIQRESGQSLPLSLTDKLVNKLDTDAHSSHVLAVANADNEWDLRECDQILDACDRVDAETRELREMALLRKSGTSVNLRSFARAAVNNRNGGRKNA